MDKVQTKPVRVQITTDEYEIQGYMHLKLGGYQSRLSDMLNMKEANFLPVTDAFYLSIRKPDAEPSRAKTMLIRQDTIKVVIPLVDDEVWDKPAAAKQPSKARVRNVTPEGWG